MFKNFPIIYKTARQAGRTEMQPYKRHIINTLTAPQTPNNRISSPHTSYLLPLISYLLSLISYLLPLFEYAFDGFDGLGGYGVDFVRLFEAWREASRRIGELLVLLVGQRCVGIDFFDI